MISVPSQESEWPGGLGVSILIEIHDLCTKPGEVAVMCIRCNRYRLVCLCSCDYILERFNGGVSLCSFFHLYSWHNTIDPHDKTGILLKFPLNTIATPPPPPTKTNHYQLLVYHYFIDMIVYNPESCFTDLPCLWLLTSYISLY